ncbi:Serine/threonine-protein phosphatase 7 long form homolog [Linum grandiflorum]
MVLLQAWCLERFPSIARRMHERGLRRPQSRIPPLIAQLCRWEDWYHDRHRPASVSEFRLLFDEGTQFQLIPYVGDEYSDIVEREYRVVAPLFCFRSVMWHHPDRVLRQFGMEQPIPRTEMTKVEVTRLLGLTRRREIGMRETMQQYLARWDARDDHVAETAPV